MRTDKAKYYIDIRYRRHVISPQALVSSRLDSSKLSLQCVNSRKNPVINPILCISHCCPISLLFYSLTVTPLLLVTSFPHSLYSPLYASLPGPRTFDEKGKLCIRHIDSTPPPGERFNLFVLWRCAVKKPVCGLDPT